MPPIYRNTGKQILSGKEHVADAATNEVAEIFVGILNDHASAAKSSGAHSLPDAEAIAAIIDPTAWTDRGRRSDTYRRTSTPKKARQIIELMGGESAAV